MHGQQNWLSVLVHLPPSPEATSSFSQLLTSGKGGTFVTTGLLQGISEITPTVKVYLISGNRVHCYGYRGLCNKGTICKLADRVRKSKRESVQHCKACDIPELLSARAEGLKPGSSYRKAGRELQGEGTSFHKLCTFSEGQQPMCD